MTSEFLSTDLFLAWHDWVWVIASVLLLLGLVYALIEFCLSSRPVARWMPGGNSLRARIVAGLIVVGVVPAVSLGLFLAERSAHLRQERLIDRLEETAQATAGAVDQFIDKHRAGVMTAASAASEDGNLSRDRLIRWLLLYHEIYSDFLTMLSTDANGNVLAATSDMTGFLTPVPELAGHNVSDRPYFLIPMETGQPFISRVFQGRDLGRDPIVAVSAPLLGEGGESLGIVEGSLDLSAFQSFDENRLHADRSEMILVDQSHRVIYASATTGLTQLESISSNPMIAANTNGGDGYEFRDEWNAQVNRFVGASASTRNGWTVFYRAPLRQISNQMLGDYLISAFALFVAFVLSLLLAGGMFRRVTRSVNDMNAAIASFRVDGSEEKVRTPRNTPSEFRPIFAQMRKRSASLRRAHKRLRSSIDTGIKLQSELTQAITLKEVEIAERTAELEEANEKLSTLSKIDALTGIPNRREFEAFTKRLWRVSAREQSPVALILIDIDYFKLYNDNLGHLAGDDCLRRVAGALKSSALRPMDIVARYGGEEFVAALGHAGDDEALIVADRMRNAVLKLGITHPESPHKLVTVSVGVSSAVSSEDKEFSELVKAADECLYEAKAAGRNCVVWLRDDNYARYDERAPDSSGAVIPIRSGSESRS